MAASSIWQPEPYDLADLLAPPEWQKDAACLEHPELAAAYFPERGHDPKAAKAVCRRCLVRFECLDYAVTEGIVWGVWGGLSPQERRSARAA